MSRFDCGDPTIGREVAEIPQRARRADVAIFT